MEKLPFEAPKLEITYFEAEDVVTTSGGGDFGGTAPGFEPGDWP